MTQNSAIWILLLTTLSLSMNACTGGKRDTQPSLLETVKQGHRLTPDDSASDTAPQPPIPETVKGAPLPSPALGTTSLSTPSNSNELDQKILNGSTEALKKIDESLFTQWELKPPQAATEDPNQGPQIKILNQKTLAAVDSKNQLVIFKNSLQTKDRAMKALVDEGKGLFCQTSGAELLKDNDTLSMTANGDEKPLDNDPSTLVTTFNYLSPEGKSFSLICTNRGHNSIQEFESNFKTLIEFPGSASSNTSSTSQETPEEAAANDIKLKSFRVVNAEAFSQIVTKEQRWEESQSMMAGKVVPGAVAIESIVKGQAEEACQIWEIKGKIEKGKVYRQTDKGAVGSNRQLGTGTVYYIYSADEANQVNLVCVVRSSTPVIEIFNVFNSVLEFGAAP